MGLMNYLKNRKEKRMLMEAEAAGIKPEKYKAYLKQRKKDLFIERQKLRNEMDVNLLRKKAQLMTKQQEHRLEQIYTPGRNPRVSNLLASFDIVPQQRKTYPKQKQGKIKPRKQVNVMDDSDLMRGLQ